MTVSEQARNELKLYQQQTGLSLGQIGVRMGYARRSLIQFASNSSYGNGDRCHAQISHLVLAFIKEHPSPRPKLPGKLYDTANTRILRETVELAREGAISLIYGPPGTQKSFVFQYLLAEAWERENEPGLVYVYASAAMGRKSLTKEIARGLCSVAVGTVSDMITNILHTVSERKRPPALIVDEAHHLGGSLDTLEVLREIADRAQIGMVLAGHDNLEDIFQSKRGGLLEQWFSRIDYHKRLPGLSADEVRRIARAELGELSENALKAVVEGTRVKDYREDETYLSMRRLVKVLTQAKRSRVSKAVA
jgi:DNA transposition AAA+ family ATPase